MRKYLLKIFTKHLLFNVIKYFYKPSYQRIKLSDLATCPSGSLGKATLSFLEINQFELFHGYEVHDLKHVLLNYQTDLFGEIEMQFFELGNGNKSISVLMVVIAVLVLCPDGILRYISSYKRGKSSRPLIKIKLENCLHMNLSELQSQLEPFRISNK
ncbi:MAG: Coq4 family protein [Bacteroidia bacterium]